MDGQSVDTPAGVWVDPAALQVRAERLGGAPVVNAVLDRIGFDRLLGAALGEVDPRAALAPATAIGLLVRNLALGRIPLYGLADWAGQYDPGLLGLSAEQCAALADDVVGRALDRLFAADRTALLTRISLATVEAFAVRLEELHNDSTSLTLFGAYRAESDPIRPARAPARPARGFSKDHRGDLAQLVCVLTIAVETGAGGAVAGVVPLACRLADGNTEDTTTHVESWDACRRLAGTPGFLYVADSKLATRDNMDYIDGEHGRFLSVLPASRAEDGTGRAWIAAGGPTWAEVCRRPGRRRSDPDQVYWAAPAPTPSAEGFRIVWIRSAAGRDRDAASRAARIEKARAALAALAASLDAPRRRLATREGVEDAARQAITDAGAARWVRVAVTDEVVVEHRQARRGRPGKDTSYRRVERHRFGLTHSVDETQVRTDAACDGCFPLVTNDRTMSEAALLAAYKRQPHIERDNHVLKSVIEAAPVLLNSPRRIDAFSVCWYAALLVHNLIERQLRQAMAAAGIAALPLYPERRACAAPTAERVLHLLDPLVRTHVSHHGDTLAVVPPRLDPLQAQLLELLGVPRSVYETVSPGQ